MHICISIVLWCTPWVPGHLMCTPKTGHSMLRRTPKTSGVCIECHGTQCVHLKTIEMHICMRRKQFDWCMHCGQEIPTQVYALSWCKPVYWSDNGIGIYKCSNKIALGLYLLRVWHISWTEHSIDTSILIAAIEVHLHITIFSAWPSHHKMEPLVLIWLIWGCYESPGVFHIIWYRWQTRISGWYFHIDLPCIVIVNVDSLTVVALFSC